MRYVAKVHVLDVLDQIVISGYIYDADPISDPDHSPFEFTYQTPGRGVSDPVAWLATSLYSAVQEWTRPRSQGLSGAESMGGSHTVSESGDTRPRLVG